MEVRHGPKGTGDGGAVELTKAAAVRSAAADRRPRKERGATECSVRAREGG
jgi:hypothetical protein